MGRVWLPPQDSNLPSPVNSRQPSPRWLDGNIFKIFVAQFGGARRNRTDDILLAEQALSLLSYGPEMVHKDGIEPPTRAPSTRRSTSELLVRNVVRNGAAGGKSNPSPPRWQRGALPLSYGREFGGRNLVSKNLVGRDGFEPPQNERRFYRALGSPVPSLPETCCRGGSRARLERLMRLPGSRTSMREIGGEPTCRSPWLYATHPLRTGIRGRPD